MSVSKDNQDVICDFCETRTTNDNYNKVGSGWTFGQRGYVIPTSVCVLERELKHGCPNPLCQAKLLVWARS